MHAAEDELDAYLDGLRNYGSLFLGEQATVAFGDKAVGTNHVLPTAGAARYTGGLWVGKFLKTLTYQRLTEEGMRQIAPAAAAISEAELFPGHALTARMRLERARPRLTASPAAPRWSPGPGAASGAAARSRSRGPGADVVRGEPLADELDSWRGALTDAPPARSRCDVTDSDARARADRGARRASTCSSSRRARTSRSRCSR